MDIERITEAANSFLQELTDDQREKASFDISDRSWRLWSNPEFLINDRGLRLERLSDSLVAKIDSVLKATLSPEGYQKATSSRRINAFLGELCYATGIMNELSYNFLLFGTPSTTQPWGFSLYGHHLCLAVYLCERQIVIAPTFCGAEPNVIDEGLYKGTRIMEAERSSALKLMQSFTQPEKEQTQLFKSMEDPCMNEGRVHFADERHLGGAFQDNRIVPYEGLNLGSINQEQKEMLRNVLDSFHLWLPQPARNNRLEEIFQHLDQTYFCWIGGYEVGDAFYYRIQSPVVFVELDHHKGVWLSNQQPKPFHIHTIVRMPNQGDYGNALRPADKKL